MYEAGRFFNVRGAVARFFDVRGVVARREFTAGKPFMWYGAASLMRVNRSIYLPVHMAEGCLRRGDWAARWLHQNERKREVAGFRRMWLAALLCTANTASCRAANLSSKGDCCCCRHWRESQSRVEPCLCPVQKLWKHLLWQRMRNVMCAPAAEPSLQSLQWLSIKKMQKSTNHRNRERRALRFRLTGPSRWPMIKPKVSITQIIRPTSG